MRLGVTGRHSRCVVLVGAGNAHLQLVRNWRGAAHTALTLVNAESVVPYSGMVPGVIAKQYAPDDAFIDLLPLCVRADVTFVQADFMALDARASRIQLSGRPPMGFDVLSLNLGSRPAVSDEDLRTHALPTKPLSKLIQAIEQVERGFVPTRPFRFVVVGGGAGGAELALALKKRWERHKQVEVTLIHSQESLLPTLSSKVHSSFLAVLANSGVRIVLNAAVTKRDGNSLLLSTGEKLAYDAYLLTTQASGLPVMSRLGMSLDERGLLIVNDYLQVPTHSNIFATGDCATLSSHPRLPKSGVYAVRQGPILMKNIMATLLGKPLTRFRPQKNTLALFNTGDGGAILSYGRVSSKGRWAFQLKNYIDQRWVRSFRMTSVPEMAGEEMRCGGCGAKVGAGVLRGALGELETGTNEFVVADWRAQEDAAVLKGPGGGLELQTVDYFRSFIKDPFLFGELAVEHALNDLWAKRARPVSALAIATLPHAAGHIQRQVLLELLSGAEKGLRPHGVALMGGHSSEGAELALGFCLTGHALDGKWVRKGGLQEGEVLILTKRLGTGVLLAAHARGESSSHWFWDVLDEMRRSHGSLMRAFAEWDVRACTDVSGFGFAGHAQEMATASRHSVEIWLSHLPRFAAAHPLVEKGIQSTLHEQNVQVLAGNHSLSRFDKIILCDPQTSGGLLFSVPEKQVPTVLSTLHSQGFTSAAAVGRVLESGTSLAFIGKSS